MQMQISTLQLVLQGNSRVLGRRRAQHALQVSTVLRGRPPPWLAPLADFQHPLVPLLAICVLLGALALLPPALSVQMGGTRLGAQPRARSVPLGTSVRLPPKPLPRSRAHLATMQILLGELPARFARRGQLAPTLRQIQWLVLQARTLWLVPFLAQAARQGTSAQWATQFPFAVLLGVTRRWVL